MKFYIASGLDRADEVVKLRDQLTALGHESSYDWTTHGSVQDDGHGRIREVAAAEMAGVVNAELFIALLPGGRGTHTELGMALAFAQVDDRLPKAADASDPPKMVVLVGVDADGLLWPREEETLVAEAYDLRGVLIAERDWLVCRQTLEDGTVYRVRDKYDDGGRTCAFYLHPRVDRRFKTPDELVAWLDGQAVGRVGGVSR